MKSLFDQAIDWERAYSNIDRDGYSSLPPFLSRDRCERIRNYYSGNGASFRSRVVMARHNFGIGEYQYFSYPLPDEIQSLRQYFYARLAPVANLWNKRLGIEGEWPAELEELLERCHEAGQSRPTPLLLRYGKGGFNCLHQDLYGAIHFPFQLIVMLSQPHEDFEGGELILVEQRPRMQSKPIVPRLEQGGAVVIPVQYRPRVSARGYNRATMRHGVGEITSGHRHTLGIIFHDAE